MATVSLSESSKTPSSITVASSTSNDLGGAVTTRVYLGTSASGTLLGSYGTAARVSTTTPRVSSSSFSRTGLSESTSYSFYAETKGDVTGNVVATGSLSITTPPNATISISEISKTATSIQIQINSTNNLGGAMTATLYRGSDSVPVGSYSVPANSSLNTSITDTGLTGSTTYSYYARIRGTSSGTLYATSSTLNITTNAPPTPPSQNYGPSLSGTGVSGSSLSASAGSYNYASSVTTRIAYNTSGSFSGSAAVRTSPYTVADLDASSPPYYFAATDIVIGTNGSTYYYYSSAIISKLRVIFNSQGGDDTSDISYVAGSSITLPYTSRSGYSFNGWYTASSGGTLAGGAYSSYTPSSSSSSTLYAQWTAFPVSQNYSPSLSGTGISGDYLSASVGSYNYAANNPGAITTTIAYSTNGIFSPSGMPSQATTYYQVKDGDASYPPYYFATMDKVVGIDGNTSYWYSSSIISKLKITFNVDGGSAVDPISYVATSPAGYITLPYTSKNGYTFDGWYTAINKGGTKVGSVYDSYQTPTNASSTLYAGWTLTPIAQYSPPYISGTGIAQEDLSVSSGSYANGSLESTKITYNTTGDFTSGTTNAPSYLLDAPYTITQNDAKYPSYYFVAVDKVRNPLGTDYYYYSTSIRSKFKITYVPDNGDSSYYITFYSEATNTPIDLPTPSKTGYTFAGWYDESNTLISSPYTPLNMNKTLTAQWTVNQYTLTYNASGGSVSPSTKTVDYGSAYGTLPTPTRTGYTFLGWYAESSYINQISSSTTYTSNDDISIYAKWQGNEYIVSFYLNYPLGGTQDGAYSTKSVYYGSPYGELPNITRPGYSFDGWYTQSSGGTKVISTDIYIYDTNTNLFAHWTATTPIFSDQSITATAYLGKDVSTSVDHIVVATPANSYSIIYSGSGLNPTSWLTITKEAGSGDGMLAGKPTQIGVYTFRVRATSDGGYTDSGLFTMTVLPAGRRSLGYSMTELTVAKRYDGSAWVDMKVMRRYDGSTWKDISNI